MFTALIDFWAQNGSTHYHVFVTLKQSITGPEQKLGEKLQCIYCFSFLSVGLTIFVVVSVPFNLAFSEAKKKANVKQ